MHRTHMIHHPLDRLKQSFLQLPTSVKRLWVAFSGGLDSYVLLHATRQLYKEYVLTAVHINHGLQAEASTFEKKAQSICDTLTIPLVIHDVSKQIAQYQKSGHSPEEAARQARYSALTHTLTTEDGLLTGHHLEDQAETVLLNLMRGAGIQGLSGMSMLSCRGDTYHLRPLLDWTYTERLAYARQHQLQWIEDPTNQDRRFLRNFVRHTVLPTLKHSWPSATRQLARTAAHCLEASQLAKEMAIQDWIACKGSASQVSISNLLSLSLLRRRNALRYWLQQQLGCPVSTAQFRRIEQLLYTSSHANPSFVLRGSTIKRYRDHLYCIDTQPHAASIKRRTSIQWNPNQTCQLPHCKLSITRCKGQGIRETLLSEYPFLEIRWRKGGETFHPASRIGSRSLKKLFQEWGIVPWERDSWPLIYHSGTLVAVPGHAISKESVAGPDEQGLQIIVTFPSS